MNILFSCASRYKYSTFGILLEHNLIPTDSQNKITEVKCLTGKRAIGPVGRNLCHATVLSVI